MGEGKRETERETRQRDRERGKRDTSRAALPWAARLEGDPETVEATGEVRDESREHGSAAGEGGARRTPGRCEKGKEVGQGEEEARTEQRR